MSLKSLLVHVNSGDQTNHLLDAATILATAHDAHVTGLAVRPPFAFPIGTPALLPEEAIEAYNRQQDEAMEAARERFEDAMQRAGIIERSEWRKAIGDPATVLALHGRYADLVIVGQTDPNTPQGEIGTLPDNLVLEAGRPVLVVPYIGPGETIGTRVMVAWNGSREAARAVADAMPILERAKKVEVLVAEPVSIGDLPGADIARHLARHGIRVEASRTIPDVIDVGDTLLNNVSDFGADLLVMGAYGHSRMREIVLGGATRHILQHMTVPVLMSH